MTENDILIGIGNARRQLEHMENMISLESKYSIPSKPGKDGYYRVMVKDGTKKSGRSTIAAKSIEQLLERLREYDNQNYSFRVIFEAACENKLKYVKDETKRLSVYTTITSYHETYKRFIAGTFLSDASVGKITKKDLEKFIFNTLDVKDVRPKAFGNLKSLLNMVFKYAYQEEIILDNPYARINLDMFKTMLTQPPSINERYHSDSDISRMMIYIHADQSMRPKFIASYALELQMLTGMRRAEIPPLRWEHICDDYILICEQQILVKPVGYSQYHAIVPHTKTYKDRRFPITNEIRIFLDKLIAMQSVYYKDSKFLFPSKTAKNGCITNDIVYAYYTKMCNELGIPISKDLKKGTHAFRRTHITNFVNKSNGNILMASEIFGNSVQIANKHYYTGVDIEEARKILE